MLRSAGTLFFLTTVFIFLSAHTQAGSALNDPTLISDSGALANGQQIYLTGVSASGQPIASRGGSMGMGQMHATSCASCHGNDREGRRLWPRFWIKAPALTAEALFGDDDHGDNSSEHGDHELYDAASLRRAITLGLDPGGNQLNPAMPLWVMSEADLADLIAFLGAQEDQH